MALESLIAARVVGTAHIPCLGASSLAPKGTHILLDAFERISAILAAIGVVTVERPFSKALRKFDTCILTPGLGNTGEAITARNGRAVGILRGMAFRNVVALMMSIVEFNTSQVFTTLDAVDTSTPFDPALRFGFFATHFGTNLDAHEVITAARDSALATERVAGESKRSTGCLSSKSGITSKELVVHNADVVTSAKVKNILTHIVHVRIRRLAIRQVAMHQVLKACALFVLEERVRLFSQTPMFGAVFVTILLHAVHQGLGNSNVFTLTVGPVVPDITVSTSQETYRGSIPIRQVDNDIDIATFVGGSKRNGDLEFRLDVLDFNVILINRYNHLVVVSGSFVHIAFHSIDIEEYGAALLAEFDGSALVII